MSVVLKPCSVPWSVSPSTSGVTLVHAETDVEPECTVVFGGGRLCEDGRTDVRRIELVFYGARHARVGPHRDDQGIEAVGYHVIGRYSGPTADYRTWRKAEWRQTGNCPNPGFYVATESDWLRSIAAGSRHYVIDGRDGYVEVIAAHFSWREWLWTSGPRDELTRDADVVARGEGSE